MLHRINMRLDEERLGKSYEPSNRESYSRKWAHAVIRMLQFFGWLILFGGFVGSFVFTWFFGTVAVAGAQGIHREVNLMGIAAAGGIFFFGILVALFLFVVCAAATALVDLHEPRRKGGDEVARVPLDALTLSQEDRENEPEEYMRNLPGLAQTPTS